MKKASIASLLALFLSIPATVAAAVPPTLAFSARVADNGRPVTGPQNFTFTLWTVASGGTAGVEDIWTESQAAVPVNDGVVVTTLGDVANGGTALPPFDGTPLWLEVTMGATTFSPRMAVQSVPYAMRAGTIDRMPAAISGPVGGSGSITTTDTLFATTTATFPGPGFAFVMGQASTAQNSTTPNQILFCTLREDGATFKDMWWEAYKNDGFYGNWQSGGTVKAVSAGAHTYALYCRTNAGAGFYTMGQIHVLYFPNTL